MPQHSHVVHAHSAISIAQVPQRPVPRLYVSVGFGDPLTGHELVPCSALNELSLDRHHAVGDVQDLFFSLSAVAVAVAVAIVIARASLGREES